MSVKGAVREGWDGNENTSHLTQYSAEVTVLGFHTGTRITGLEISNVGTRLLTTPPVIEGPQAQREELGLEVASTF